MSAPLRLLLGGHAVLGLAILAATLGLTATAGRMLYPPIAAPAILLAIVTAGLCIAALAASAAYAQGKRETRAAYIAKTSAVRDMVHRIHTLDVTLPACGHAKCWEASRQRLASMDTLYDAAREAARYR